MIGDIIKARRLELGISQMELAKMTDTAQSTITGWESGKYKPTYDALPRLASALGLTLGELCELPGDSSGIDSKASQLLRDYNDLPPADRDAVAAMVATLKSARKLARSKIG